MVESIRASGAIVAAMLARLEIPFGVILASIVLKEKVSNKAKAATSLSLHSVILLSQTDMSFSTFDDANARGVGLGLIVALAFSLSTIYAKWIFNTFKIPSLLMTWVRTSMGAGISILIFVLSGGDIVQSLASISLMDWLAIGFLGLFVNAIAYMAYYKSLSLLDAHITQIMLGVALMIAVILGILIGETLSIFQWLGIVLVVISIYLIQTSKD
ncbi:DMT family transporter [Candidatus Saccharibacteria bacterium]|nr:DMT family transporter [Candidatus Saccharibacteria bacterium]